MISIKPDHLAIIKAILKKYPFTFYAFGSRVKGTNRPLSDLDICFTDNIPLNVRAHIDADFEESDLPFKVDIINLHECSPEFRNLIEKDLKKLQ